MRNEKLYQSIKTKTEAEKTIMRQVEIEAKFRAESLARKERELIDNFVDAFRALIRVLE